MVTGFVDIKVVNVGSGKQVVFAGGFRYTPKMVITLPLRRKDRSLAERESASTAAVSMIRFRS